MKKDAEMREFLESFEEKQAAFVGEQQQLRLQIEKLVDHLKYYDDQLESKSLAPEDSLARMRDSTHDLAVVEKKLNSNTATVESLVAGL